jgi:hypothetical protein
MRLPAGPAAKPADPHQKPPLSAPPLAVPPGADGSAMHVSLVRGFYVPWQPDKHICLSDAPTCARLRTLVGTTLEQLLSWCRHLGTSDDRGLAK